MLEKILGEIETALEKMYLEVADNCDISDLHRDCDRVTCVADHYLRVAIPLVREIFRKHMNDGWIPCEERLPTKEEYLKDGGRFILDDGNRRYQGLFDIRDSKFKFSKHISGFHYELFEYKCVIAWQPLPEPYRPEKGEEE